MKKIFSIFLVFALVMSGFVGCASASTNAWGQKYESVDGKVIFYNQTVVVTNTDYHITPLETSFFEILTDCTVTIQASGKVTVVDSDGNAVRSANTYPFRFALGDQFVPQAHFTNQPSDNGDDEEEDLSHNDFLTILTDDLGSSMAPYYKTQESLMKTKTGIVFTDDDGNRYRGVLSERYVSNGFVYWSITFTSKTCPTIYDFIGRTATDGVNLSVGALDYILTNDGDEFHNVHAVEEGQTSIVVNYEDGTFVIGCVCM